MAETEGRTSYTCCFISKKQSSSMGFISGFRKPGKGLGHVTMWKPATTTTKSHSSKEPRSRDVSSLQTTKPLRLPRSGQHPPFSPCLFTYGAGRNKEPHSETVASPNQITPPNRLQSRPWLHIPDFSPRERVTCRRHQIVRSPGLSPREPWGEGGLDWVGWGCGVRPQGLGERLG